MLEKESMQTRGDGGEGGRKTEADTVLSTEPVTTLGS